MVKHFDDLHRGAVLYQGRKSVDVREVDRGIVEQFWQRHLTSFQSVGHVAASKQDL